MEQEESDQVQSGYEDLFICFSKLVEKWFLRSLAVLLSLLIVSQLLMQIPELRYYLVKIEQLEGVPYHRAS